MKRLSVLIALGMVGEGMLMLMNPRLFTGVAHRVNQLFAGPTEDFLDDVTDRLGQYGRQSPDGLRTIAGMETALGLLMLVLALRAR